MYFILRMFIYKLLFKEENICTKFRVKLLPVEELFALEPILDIESWTCLSQKCNVIRIKLTSNFNSLKLEKMVLIQIAATLVYSQ